MDVPIIPDEDRIAQREVMTERENVAISGAPPPPVFA